MWYHLGVWSKVISPFIKLSGILSNFASSWFAETCFPRPYLRVSTPQMLNDGLFGVSVMSKRKRRFTRHFFAHTDEFGVHFLMTSQYTHLISRRCLLAADNALDVSLVPLHSFLEEKRKRVGSQHWISHKTFKMQRFCSSHISKNWKFLIFFNFFKCASQIFNNSGNINHQNGSETCPKSTKNSRTKGFPESDTTLFRLNFDVTAYVSESKNAGEKNIGKSFWRCG